MQEVVYRGGRSGGRREVGDRNRRSGAGHTVRGGERHGVGTRAGGDDDRIEMMTALVHARSRRDGAVRTVQPWIEELLVRRGGDEHRLAGSRLGRCESDLLVAEAPGSLGHGRAHRSGRRPGDGNGKREQGASPDDMRHAHAAPLLQLPG